MISKILIEEKEGMPWIRVFYTNKHGTSCAMCSRLASTEELPTTIARLIYACLWSIHRSAGDVYTEGEFDPYVEDVERIMKRIAEDFGQTTL